MNYITLNKTRKKSDEKSAKINENETIIISAEHPLAIAHQKSLENYRKGKTKSFREWFKSDPEFFSNDE